MELEEEKVTEIDDCLKIIVALARLIQGSAENLQPNTARTAGELIANQAQHTLRIMGEDEVQ